MKKPIVITAAAIIAISMLGLGFGLGGGKGKGEGDGNAPAVSSVSSPESAVSSQPEESSAGRAVISVSVVDNDYSYENKRIELDELMNVLSEMEPGFVVEITDDNASLKAYSQLTDRLDDLSIPYAE